MMNDYNCSFDNQNKAYNSKNKYTDLKIISHHSLQ